MVVFSRNVTRCLRNICRSISIYNRLLTEAPLFPGAKTTWTEKLEFLNQNSYPSIPVYRVMDRQGNVIVPDEDPKVPEETLIKMYKDMVLLNSMDKILYESQRYFLCSQQ
ncbi:unnamed protein product [Acanthoscelides obtectus]|uniref:2-oxoisovalerate dehydrogenase subunit alpha n=1 Tax=Acanthoscelides obtectus TaxID=200917 RepID=A0A9P0Q572_ACAOB|nr:unnamed protein product [Acanthoscelides obtectus]CAK1684306.1 2-oxoisovalerate dehydrogenase subunit alpha, mitochondrial [Acanthoscelides obtectus]